MNIYEILIILIVLTLAVKADNAPLIETKYGAILGKSDNFTYMYLGIPFALPPVDDLRWKDPIAITPWSPNILNGTNFKSACPQIDCTSQIPSESCPVEVSKNIYFYYFFYYIIF